MLLASLILLALASSSIVSASRLGTLKSTATKLGYVYPYTSTDPAKRDAVRVKVQALQPAADRFAVENVVADRMLLGRTIEPGRPFLLKKGDTLFHATQWDFNTFRPTNDAGQPRGTWFSADWPEGVKLVISNELARVLAAPEVIRQLTAKAVRTPAEEKKLADARTPARDINVRTVQVTRDLALYTMFPTQEETLADLQARGWNFQRNGVAVRVVALAPNLSPDAVAKKRAMERQFSWYGNTAETARVFIVNLCSVLAQEQPPMYGWRNSYDQDEIMICPDAMQAAAGPPVVMAEKGGRVCPGAGYAAAVTVDPAHAAGKTFFLHQALHKPTDTASRLKSPLFERSTFLLRRLTAQPQGFDAEAKEDDEHGRKWLIGQCKTNVNLKAVVAARIAGAARPASAQVRAGPARQQPPVVRGRVPANMPAPSVIASLIPPAQPANRNFPPSRKAAKPVPQAPQRGGQGRV